MRFAALFVGVLRFHQMDYPATKNRPMNVAFVLDDEALRRLPVLLEEAGKSARQQIVGPDAPQYTVQFADGVSVPFQDIEEVIRQSNAPDRPIVSLTATTQRGFAAGAYVVMRGEPDPTIEYTIRGPQKDVIYLGAKFDEWISSITQRHSFFREHSTMTIVAAIFVPIILGGYALPRFFPQQIAQHGWIKGAVIFGAWILEALSVRLFPPATFAIGHGKHRYKTLKRLRTLILVSVPVGIAISLIATWIYVNYHR
jgi:hypothetical protein